MTPLHPSTTRDLLGREKDLAALADAVRASRLVSVVGAPGVGKTALVERWLATRERAAGRAAVFVPVEGAKTEEELAPKIAAALGVPLPSGGFDRFARVLAAAPLLCVLDGFDEAAAAVPALSSWLASAPELTLVLTHGAPLGAGAERVLKLSPLAKDQAIALFEARAAEVGWRPKRTPDEARAVSLLAERLDGLPLALELAAARASVLSPKQMLERLDRDLGLLERREALGGTVSLRSAFALSWSLLDRSSQLLLAASSVFTGSFTVDAIEAVLPDLPASDVAGALDDVARRSLASRVSSADDEVRFRLLSTVRSFARTELDALDPAGRTVALADRFVVELAERLAAALETAEEPAAAARLHELADDLGSAVGRSLSRDPALAARGAIALATFSAPRGSAPVPLLTKALTAAKRTGDDLLVGRLAYGIARARARLGLNDEARAALDDALARTGDSADRAFVARVLIERGKQRMQRGDFEGARADLDGADHILEEADDPFAAGLAANERGRLEEAIGALAAAASSFLDARSRFRHAGSARMNGIALQNLAVVRYAEGRLEEARVLLEEALELHRAAHDPASAADNLLNTGSVHLTAGRLDLAEEITVRALEEERRLGNRRFEGLALGNLAIIAHERAHWQVAFDRYQRALSVFRETGDKRFAAVFTPFLAACEASLGLDREAAEDFDAARTAFEAMGDPGNLAVLDALLGLMDLHPGESARPRVDEASARLARAREALSSGSEASRTPELAVAARLLGDALERRRGTAPPPRPSATPAPDEQGKVLVLGPDIRWFEVQRSRIDLAARAAPRRILTLLVEQRLRAPGVGLAPEALFAAGWPGQRAKFEAARARVYTAIRTLRRLGLEDVLLRQDDGYLLDPGVRLETRAS